MLGFSTFVLTLDKCSNILLRLIQNGNFLFSSASIVIDGWQLVSYMMMQKKPPLIGVKLFSFYKSFWTSTGWFLTLCYSRKNPNRGKKVGGVVEDIEFAYEKFMLNFQGSWSFGLEISKGCNIIVLFFQGWSFVLPGISKGTKKCPIIPGVPFSRIAHIKTIDWNCSIESLA